MGAGGGLTVSGFLPLDTTWVNVTIIAQAGPSWLFICGTSRLVPTWVLHSDISPLVIAFLEKEWSRAVWSPISSLGEDTSTAEDMLVLAQGSVSFLNSLPNSLITKVNFVAIFRETGNYGGPVEHTVVSHQSVGRLTDSMESSCSPLPQH
jgi:hypothetical protein